MKHERISSLTAKALFGAKSPRLVEAEPRRPFRLPGEGLDEVLYICSGLLAIYRPDNLGRRAIVALRFPNEVILAGGRTPSYGLIPIIRSSIAISTSAVSGTADCLMLTQRNELIAHEWLVRQSHADANRRVAHLLCETAIRSGQGTRAMICPFTQQQIAEITGQTNVNVNRVMMDLERQGLIRRDKKRAITFTNWHELARLGAFRADYLSPWE